MEIVKYNPDYKTVWDSFIHKSKNGTFLFFRDFMEYHAGRFTDHSLIFYSKNKPVALLPGNILGDSYYSHQGLTYGGLILSDESKVKDVLGIFGELKNYLHTIHITKLIYKTIPHIYHKNPAEEDLYALFRNNAVFYSRAVSSVINMAIPPVYSQLRKRQIKKASASGLTVNETSGFTGFWNILTANLNERYGVDPVHSLDEICYLKTLFPKNIRLFTVSDASGIIAGCVVFETEQVAHIQYISANTEGKSNGALDFLFDYLIKKIYKGKKKYFDFGISTEKNGLYLNEGLVYQKEGFGARSVVYDTYIMNIAYDSIS